MRLFTPNLEVKKKVLDLHMVEKVKYCYQCSRCTEHCPVSQLDSRYDPRVIVMQGLLGLSHMILQPEKQFDLWACQTCDMCNELCPNDIVLTDIFTILKNQSMKMGLAPEAYQSQAKMVMQTGQAIPLQDAIARRREKMALPTLPLPDVGEIQKILKATQFDKKIGYEEGKK